MLCRVRSLLRGFKPTAGYPTPSPVLLRQFGLGYSMSDYLEDEPLNSPPQSPLLAFPSWRCPSRLSQPVLPVSSCCTDGTHVHPVPSGNSFCNSFRPLAATPARIASTHNVINTLTSRLTRAEVETTHVRDTRLTHALVCAGSSLFSYRSVCEVMWSREREREREREVVILCEIT